MKLGIMNPYLKMTGNVFLRNDNPQNIIFQTDDNSDSITLKNKGNQAYLNKDYMQAK